MNKRQAAGSRWTGSALGWRGSGHSIAWYQPGIRAVPEDPDIGTTSLLTKFLFVVLGLVLVLVALGIIPIDPSRVHTSPAVFFATGMVFMTIGLVAFFQPHQDRGGDAYRFALVLLVASSAAVTSLVALNSHDEKLCIGPFVFKGPAVDAFGKVVLSLAAMILWGLAVWSWKVWWHRQ
jgi:hypothetical protein